MSVSQCLLYHGESDSEEEVVSPEFPRDNLPSDVITAATFLAGSILVYLGNVNINLRTLTRDQQRKALALHQRRAKFAFGAFVLSVGAVGFALASSYYQCIGPFWISVGLLFFAFLGGVYSVFMLTREEQDYGSESN